MNTQEQTTKQHLIDQINQRVTDKILEKSNADLLIKLISNAESIDEAIAITGMGTIYKRTGFNFDHKAEKMTDDIHYFKKRDDLSFRTDKDKPLNKLIIGDNYYALRNLLIEYQNKVDVIYIDPPYGSDSMGTFAQTNYDNSISRDNLLSMLYYRLILAKELLADDGVIFCSIDDRNQAYVKCLFDEVFGERNFLFNIPRITKKGGKSTNTIAKNNDYIIGYSIFKDIEFGQEEKTDLSKYKYEDEYVETRGKYALTQTLDYNSLQYSKSMDFEIEIDGKTFIAGGDIEKRNNRLNGKHGVTDWVWRWSKDAVEWGKQNGFFVVKNNRIYTKSYLNCRKKNGSCEIEYIDATKSFTTLSFLDNKYSNDNAKKELDKMFDNASTLFKNPKPTSLIYSLMTMANKPSAIVLDFFAGSGTTGQAVLELNKSDNGNRQFILCQLDEKTDETPNNIAVDVTAERLKRVMTGEGYKGEKNFKWIENNTPFGGNLDVYEIKTISDFSQDNNGSAFDLIDETLYGKEKLSVEEKIRWVCENFSQTRNKINDEDNNE